MAEDTGSSVIGLIIVCAIGYGIYAFFDKKPSPSNTEQTQQQHARDSATENEGRGVGEEARAPLRTQNSWVSNLAF